MATVNIDNPPVLSLSVRTLYFFWLPVDSIIIYGEFLGPHSSCSRHVGSLDMFVSEHTARGYICIPLPAETAVAMNWVSQHDVAFNHGASETMLAAMQLVKGM